MRPTPGHADIALPPTHWIDVGLRDDPSGDDPDRGRRTRRRLLLAAAQEFDENGYHGAHLRGIVARTGTTKGALYHHFDSKLDLATAVAHEYAETGRADREDVMARDLDPLWKLLLVSDAIVARWSCDPILRGALQWMLEVPGLPELLGDSAQRFSDQMLAHLTAARERGLVRPGVEPGGLTRFIQAVGVGHHMGSELESGSGLPDYWSRMNDVWVQMLPLVAVPDWVHAWRGSPWWDRPAPRPQDYTRARGGVGGGRDAGVGTAVTHADTR